MECIDFENSTTLEPLWKDVLRFARKVAFNEGTTEADFQALRDHGVDDVGIAEIVSMAMLESGMARHAVGVAPSRTATTGRRIICRPLFMRKMSTDRSTFPFS